MLFWLTLGIFVVRFLLLYGFFNAPDKFWDFRIFGFLFLLVCFEWEMGKLISLRLKKHFDLVGFFALPFYGLTSLFLARLALHFI